MLASGFRKRFRQMMVVVDARFREPATEETARVEVGPWISQVDE